MSEDFEMMTDDQLDAIADQAAPHGPCVYVLRAEMGFKIGRTSNLERRIDTLQTGSSISLVTEVVIYTDEAVALETALHRRFSARRIQGEWFALSSDEMAFIRALNRHDIREIIDRDIPF